MRRMGFSLCWPKLKQDELTTIRFTRRDKDWIVGEIVMVVYQPRHFNYSIGVASIVKKEPRAASQAMASAELPLLTDEEAVADGFDNIGGLLNWLWKSGGKARAMQEAVNKLTLRWEHPGRSRDNISHLESILKRRKV